jgi:hypothetical protein
VKIFLICGDVLKAIIEGFGEERLDWLREFYPYKHGRPSHNT